MVTKHSTSDIPEFELATEEGKPLAKRQIALHLEELASFRGRLERLEREVYQRDNELGELKQSSRKLLWKVFESAVEIVDGLRLLVNDADQRMASSTEHAKERRSIGYWTFWNWHRRFASPEDAGRDWLTAIKRHAGAAIQLLERFEIYHVPLIEKDLRTLEFEGTPVIRWISVKNKFDDETNLYVKTEIRGLWVGRLDGQVHPVQRGQVIVTPSMCRV